MEYKKLDEYPVILKADDIAQILRTSKTRAYELMNSKGFPTLKIGYRLVVPKDKFIDWIDKNATGIEQ